MDHMILGLLLLRSCSIYELQQRIEAGLNLMYSSSLGSIQAALKKLLKAGFVEVRQENTGKRQKKIYSVTPAGKADFSSWVSSPMETESAKNPELGKLYFMAFSDPAVRCQNLRSALQNLRKLHAVLSAIVEEGLHMEVPPEAREILHYQLASARFGRDSIRFQIDWYENFLKEEENRCEKEK